MATPDQLVRLNSILSKYHLIPIPFHAGIDILKSAYRVLLLIVHPDKGGAHAESNQVSFCGEKSALVLTRDFAPKKLSIVGVDC